jgi:histidinol-phosphate aminotransferase
MYRVLTEQRAATVLPVPRLPAAEGYALDRPATRAAAARADVVWLCSPNNPTGLPEPDGSIAALLGELLGDAAADQRVPPAVVLDEAYAEFVGRSLVDLRHVYPRLVVVRTASKAYAMAGLRVGFAVARRDTIAELEPYRPPGSVATTSVTVVTEALLDPTAMVANVTRVAAERTRLTAALEALGWPVGPSVTNFLLVDLGSPERAGLAAEGLLRRGIVPRTFGDGHPLAGGLRLTVRTSAEDDRLLAAAAEIATELPSPQDPPDEAGAVEPEEDR